MDRARGRIELGENKAGVRPDSGLIRLYFSGRARFRLCTYVRSDVQRLMLHSYIYRQARVRSRLSRPTVGNHKDAVSQSSAAVVFHDGNTTASTRRSGPFLDRLRNACALLARIFPCRTCDTTTTQRPYRWWRRHRIDVFLT